MKHRVALFILLAWAGTNFAATIPVPNYSFESPVVPNVSPYALPLIDQWQRSAQPIWYDPSQNQDTPWEYLTGTFYNVPFPGQFIDNCDGAQAAFMFAVPEVALFQDYNVLQGTNSNTDRVFDVVYKEGHTYDLTVAVLGGNGGMKPGVTLQLGLYYRDAASNLLSVASTTITNSVELFATNTHFVDFQVRTPVVKAGDPWLEKHIGIQLLSSTSFDLAGGYWDLDNVRLIETPAIGLILSNSTLTLGQISFSILSDPGIQFEIQAATNIFGGESNWLSLGFFTNTTGITTFTENTTNSHYRFYRARQL